MKVGTADISERDGAHIASVYTEAHGWLDLADEYGTPGQALDGLLKWAKDRGLSIRLDFVTFPITRPASPPASPVSREGDSNG